MDSGGAMTPKEDRAINAALHNMALWNPCGFFEMDIPVIKAADAEPGELVGFNYLLSSKGNPSKWLHCFLHDRQIQRLWNNPNAYMAAIRRQGYGGIFSPDFSLYMDMPLPLQIFNTYRSRWVGAYMQAHGVPVVPTVGWAGPASYGFCFLGIEAGGTVAISTIGIKTKAARAVFFAGHEAMMERLKPSRVLIYGRKLEGLEGRYYPPCYEKLRHGQ